MKPKLRLSRKLPIAYEMVRLKTVKALGISFPLMHLGPSDGVIEQRPKKSPSRPGLLFALCKNKFLSIAAMHTQLPRWVIRVVSSARQALPLCIRIQTYCCNAVN